jgi:hypothetical protein
MERAVVVRGKLSDPSHIELEEPVSNMRGPVEVTVRPIQRGTGAPLFESATQEEWEREFHAWVQTHDRAVPIPSAESLRREALYGTEHSTTGGAGARITFAAGERTR